MIGTLDVRASDGAVCAARIAGDSGPALVFVHGVGSTAAIWDRQLDAFGDRYRCVAIELRGNGVPKPEPPPAQISRAGYAADVLAVCDALGIDRFTIVGCSLGGVVAFELWQRSPERIEAMVIVGSFAIYPDARAYAEGVKASALACGDMATFAAQRAAKLGLPPDRLRETLEQMACKCLESYTAATEATWTGNYTEILPMIRVPVLVACGERDTVAPVALSTAIAEGIPGARFAVIPDAGHVANADNPAAFNHLLSEFLISSVLA